MVRNFNLKKNVADDRRLEVLADNLTLWDEAQLGVNTTMVSSERRHGTFYPHAAEEDGGDWTLREHARKPSTVNCAETDSVVWSSLPWKLGADGRKSRGLS